MGWFGDILSGAPFGSDENSAGHFWDVMDPMDFSGKKAKNAAWGEAAREDERRRNWKQVQYDLLGRKKAPELTPQQEARIKALERESQYALYEDPAFQSNMRQVTSGGAQALASVQNQQVANGAIGGFANQGSAQDVYDRLGSQIAEVAQQQQQYKEQKRDVAAEARQNYADARRDFENAQIDAQMAIEQGDFRLLSDSMDRLYLAQAKADASLRDSAIGLVGTAFGAYTGNKKAVDAGVSKIDGAQQSRAPLARGDSIKPEYRPAYQMRGR